MKVKITNIQRFCLKDGPGIRTTIFLKGCNLKCPWCANPENISFEEEEYIYEKEKNTYGYDITLKDLENEILKDKIYYENNGGVTFSGGEPMLQIKRIEPLLNELKNKKINICVETALMINKELVEDSLEYIDEYIVDIKILEREKCYKLIKGNIEVYYANMDILFKNKKTVIFRIPLADKYTYTKKNISLIIELLKEYKPNKVEIFNIHKLAKKKYESLKMELKDINGVSQEQINNLKEQIANLSIPVEICNI